MSTSLLYHTQCVVGFQHECFEFSEGKVIQHIKRQKIKCPCCRHESISAYPLRERMVQSLPYGNKPTFLKFTVHRIYCPRCGKEYEISAQIRSIWYLQFHRVCDKLSVLSFGIVWPLGLLWALTGSLSLMYSKRFFCAT